MLLKIYANFKFYFWMHENDKYYSEMILSFLWILEILKKQVLLRQYGSSYSLNKWLNDLDSWFFVSPAFDFSFEIKIEQFF